MQQLQHYVRVCWQRLWLILLGTLICAGATYGISRSLPPVYQASALIQVNGTGNSSNNDIYSDQAAAVGDALLITSTDVLRVAAQQVPGTTLAQLQSAVSASPKSGSQVIEVRAKAADPQQAAAIANAVVRVFIQLQVQKTTAGLQSYLNQLSQNLDAAKANVSSAQKKLAQLQDIGASADQITHQEEVLDSYQESYNSLLASYRQAQLQQQQASTMLIVAQTATPPSEPVSPRVLLNTLVAAALGLLLMLVLVLLLDWIDMSIKTPEDVVNLSGLEALGSVPVSRRPLLANSAQEAARNDWRIEQAFSLIGMSFNLLSQKQHTLLMAGLKPRAGTTTTAANLATLLALTGRRVLLIDANLSRPALHTLTQRSNDHGLVDTLAHLEEAQNAGASAWLEAWRTPLENLWLLPSGPRPAYPLTALRTPKLRDFIEWLLRAKVVDLVIFDGGALARGVEALTLAPYTEGTLLVVRAGKERGEALRRAGELLERLTSPVLGVVVNRRKRGHRAYFYARYNQERELPAPRTKVAASSAPRVPEEAPEPLREPAAAPVVSTTPRREAAAERDEGLESVHLPLESIEEQLRALQLQRAQDSYHESYRSQTASADEQER